MRVCSDMGTHYYLNSSGKRDAPGDLVALSKSLPVRSRILNDEAKIKGMGAIPHAGGVAFRVWAPHAQRVSVIGSFNDWDGDKHPMQAEENGYWYADVAEAHVGDQYKFLLTTAQGEFKRIDPYAREVTSSVGNAIVHDPSFDWEGDDFHLAPWNELVIYELHVGTFNDQEDDNHARRSSPRCRRVWDI